MLLIINILIIKRVDIAISKIKQKEIEYNKTNY